MASLNRRKTFAEMDHDHELLYEEIVGRSTSRRQGPLAEFLDKKQAEQEPKTYLGYLTSLSRFREVAGDDATVGEFDERLGHRLITELRKRQLSKNTIATYIRDLKTFSRWLYETGWTERDRLEHLKRPEFVRPKFDTLTPAQKVAILAPCNPRTFLGARNLAVLALFMDTGMRREELAHVEDKRVHLKEGYVEVFSGKTEEWRIIPLSPEVVSILQNYLSQRQRFLQRPCKHRARPGDAHHRNWTERELATDTFFCSWQGDRLTENAVRLMIQRLRADLKRAGLDVHIHAHLFRHNFLTEKALDGENPSIVRRWAGHKTYEMTDYYFGIADDKLAAIQPRQSTLAGIQLPGLNGRRNHNANPDRLPAAVAKPSPNLRQEIPERRRPGRPPRSNSSASAT